MNSAAHIKAGIEQDLSKLMKTLKEMNPDNETVQRFELKELNELALATFNRVQQLFKREFH